MCGGERIAQMHPPALSFLKEEVRFWRFHSDGFRGLKTFQNPCPSTAGDRRSVRENPQGEGGSEMRCPPGLVPGDTFRPPFVFSPGGREEGPWPSALSSAAPARGPCLTVRKAMQETPGVGWGEGERPDPPHLAGWRRRAGLWLLSSAGSMTRRWGQNCIAWSSVSQQLRGTWRASAWRPRWGASSTWRKWN